MIQIENAWETWRMKESGAIFQLKKLGLEYCLLKMPEGHTLRHVFSVVQKLAEPVETK